MDKVKKLISNIRSLDVKKLKKEQIIKVVQEFGLVSDMASYGIHQQFMNKSRRETGIYQTPEQVADAILTLLKYKINSYVELGVFQGGNYLLVSEFLKLKNHDLKSFGIDITDQYMEEYVKPYIPLNIGTSKDFKGQKFDLVHIDADHQYSSVKEDWENLGQFAKICMIHDINQFTCPDVTKFWNEIKQGRKTKEFTYHSAGENIHGIGIIFNK